MRFSLISAALIVARIAAQEATDDLVDVELQASGGAKKDPTASGKPTCKKYINGEAKLALCEIELDSYTSQGDRVAKVGLYLKNIGDVGVCNLGLWVDGMETDAQVDFWPKWINKMPNEGYLDPQDGFELGANIFMTSGYPQYYIPAGFKVCKSPDAPAAAEVATYQYCKTLGGGVDGVKLVWCEDKKYTSWMNNDGTRIVHAQGRISNNGTVPVCGLKFTVDRYDQASRLWPKWFPVMQFNKNSVAPLRVDDIQEVGADVPSAGFVRPKVTLVSYTACTPAEIAQDANGDHDASAPAGKDSSDEDEGSKDALLRGAN